MTSDRVFDNSHCTIVSRVNEHRPPMSGICRQFIKTSQRVLCSVNSALGIETWYRTTRRFSILNVIKGIRSVPKKYRTLYPALVIICVSQVLVCRNYRGDVDMSEIEHFMTLLMDKEEEGTLSPILAHGGVRFMWIKHNNLYRILPRL